MWYRPKSQSISLDRVSKLVSGQLKGDGSRECTGLCSIDAPQEGGLTFVRRRLDATQLSALSKSNAAGILVPEDHPPLDGVTSIAVKDPNLTFVKLFAEFFEVVSPPPRIHAKADIASSAHIGSNVSVGAFAVIGEDAVIEDDVVIHPHVVIYPTARIGKGSVIHSGVAVREGVHISSHAIVHNGAVIGADGFGYVPDPAMGLLKVPQVGGVEIGAHVEIGANSCIDRAAFGTTRIGSGTKIDNLVQIGHNANIGKWTVLCGQVGIAGSADVGDGVIVGAQSGIAGHIKVASGVRVGARSGAINDLDEKGDYLGFPAVEAASWRRQVVALRKFPNMLRQMRRKGCEE